MENYEITKAISDFRTRLDELSKAIDIEKVKNEKQENEEKLNDPAFWNNQKESAEVLKKIKNQNDMIKQNQNLVSNNSQVLIYTLINIFLPEFFEA